MSCHLSILCKIQKLLRSSFRHTLIHGTSLSRQTKYSFYDNSCTCMEIRWRKRWFSQAKKFQHKFGHPFYLVEAATKMNLINSNLLFILHTTLPVFNAVEWTGSQDHWPSSYINVRWYYDNGILHGPHEITSTESTKIWDSYNGL